MFLLIISIFWIVRSLGEITGGQSGQIQFTPKHTGTIDREPNGVRADGKVYFYNYDRDKEGQQSEGKILAKLVDDRHLKLEYQPGSCTTAETFTKPYSYER